MFMKLSNAVALVTGAITGWIVTSTILQLKRDAIETDISHAVEIDELNKVIDNLMIDKELMRLGAEASTEEPVRYKFEPSNNAHPFPIHIDFTGI